MSIEWTIDGELQYDAEVVRCIKNKDQLSVVFKGVSDLEDFEGRLSIKITNEIQEMSGTFNFCDSIKEKARFSSRQMESGETILPAKIEGQLINFKGKEVYFKGSWTDEVETCHFIIETFVTSST